jgi:activating signal cointegrator complex subunit 3
MTYHAADDPHTKASLLLQAHVSRLPLPITDYVTDTRSVLDNSARILQAIVDLVADAGWLDSTLGAMALVQALSQGRWHDDDPWLQLPHVDHGRINAIKAKGFDSLQALVKAVHGSMSADGLQTRAPRSGTGGRSAPVGGGNHASRDNVVSTLSSVLGSKSEAKELIAAVERLPCMGLSLISARSITATQEETAPEGSITSETLPSSSLQPATAPLSFALQLEVQINRLSGKAGRAGGPPRAYAPRFPKLKDEGWWVVASVPGSNELLALKRVSVGQRAKARVMLPGTTQDGRKLSKLTIRLVSDCYLGVDHEITVDLP